MLAALTSAILLAGAVLLRDKWARLVEEPENVPHLNALRKILRPKDKLA
jgi:hypothetical protein